RGMAAIQGDPPSFHPALNPSGAARGAESLSDMVHGGLTVTDDHGETRAELAEAVPSIENGLWKVSPDGTMETTWRIRDGARWHDGAPFSAEDLVFTTRVGEDREVAVFGHIAFNSIQTVEARDPRAPVVHRKQPY